MPPRRSHRLLDHLGATGSLLCALHCALLPMLIALLPSLGVSARTCSVSRRRPAYTPGMKPATAARTFFVAGDRWTMTGQLRPKKK